MQVIMESEPVTACYCFLNPLILPQLLHRVANGQVREGFIRVNVRLRLR